MNRPLGLVAAMACVAIAAGAALLGQYIGASLALFGIVSATATALLALRGGAFAGVASGFGCGAMLATGILYGFSATFLAATVVTLLLVLIGYRVGIDAGVHRRAQFALEQEALLLRRELYRMKKDAGKVTRGTVRSFDPRRTPPAEKPPEPAPTLDAGQFVGHVASVSAASNEERILEALAIAACDAAAAGDASIFLLDRRNDRLLPGRSADGGAGAVAAENEPVIRLALKNRAVLARADAGEDAVVQAFAAASPDVELVAPLFDRQLSAGVLLVKSSRAAVGAAKAALTALAAVGGLALSNARLGRMSEQTSRTDPLTGLPNAAALRELLDEKLARGLASVLLVAADGINEVNQTYGRRAGDRTIAALARMVAMEVGAEGSVGYCGGSTLLVVLPGRRGEPVRALAERLMRRVPASVTAGPEGIARPLTISVASASALVGPADSLLADAEKALASAAAHGGNRLVEASSESTARLRAQR